jgi:uncharacterized membrane protein YedE/YeeE
MPEKLPKLHGDLLTMHLGRLVGGFVFNRPRPFIGWALAALCKTAVFWRVFSSRLSWVCK